MIMDQPADGDRDGEFRDEPAEEDEVLTIPKGPMTRARARKLKEAIGGLIRKSLEQEELIEFKSSRVDQEAMGSEENDEAFVRRNKLLQEAITKQVMEAMVKLLEEKYDQRPNDGQGQASGSRREQRRNRQGQREHAGSEETDNFYERSSHSSGSRRSTEEDEVLTIPKGPMTRARARKLKEAIGGLIRKSLEQEECIFAFALPFQHETGCHREPYPSPTD
ncbi:hypothetical protein IGI04_042444 [Brassica rapa subsp. trilocularis]|uniref:Uncharacterized protein n=1 Tax=Brassica rapa subsp. trilocularis TaxID=1813537 RepID=A0ABQ7KL85_BRACM|nr:hypothetical protein IGI04_042444 [Brassica rapa subsp. trilocularis]